MSFSAIENFEKLPERLFIEASAGTGKTFSIVHMVCQHILLSACQGKFFSMEEVACVTFTKAAAKEMRLRIKNILSFIKKACETNSLTGLPYVDAIISTPDRIPSCLRAIRQALFDMELASITTIHGFADRALACVQETSAWVTSSQVQQWILDFIYHGKQKQTFSLYEWKVVKKYFKSDSEKALLWLQETVQKEENKEEVSQEQLLNSARAAFSYHFGHVPLEDLTHALLSSAQGFEGVCTRQGEVKEEVGEYIDAILALLRGQDLGALWSLYDSSLSWDKIFSKKKKKAPSCTAYERELFERFVQEVVPLLLPIIDIAASLERIGDFVRSEFRKFLLTTGYKTPDLLVSILEQKTKNEEFIRLIRSKFQLVVVDEFQDTDPIQWKILSSLFLSKSWQGSLYVVGDPKQSIYLFRGADIYSYLSAKESFHASETVSLLTNFRASRSMVEAVNKLFSSKSQPELFALPKKKTGLEVEEVESSSLASHVDQVPVHFQFFETTSVGHFPKHKEEAAVLFPWLFSILSWEVSCGVRLEKIAILVKDKYQAERTRLFLQKHAIASMFRKGELVTQTKAFSWLQKALLLVLCSKKKQAYVDMLLDLAMIGDQKWLLESLERLVSSDDMFFFAHLVAFWDKGREVYERGGLSLLVDHMLGSPLNEKYTVSQWIEQLEDASDWYMDIEHLLELVEAKMVSKASLEEVVASLKQLEDLYEDDPLVLLRRTDPEKEAVSLLTMHGSKGLEFDVVIALGACVSSLVDKEETAEQRAEKVRQLYVVVTRAKERCYIPIPLFSEQKTTTLSIIEAYLFECLKDTFSKEAVYLHIRALVSSHPTIFSLSEHVAHAPSLSYVKKIARPIKGALSPQAYRIEYSSFSSLHKKALASFKPKRELVSTTHGALWGTKIHQAVDDILSSSTRPTVKEDVSLFLPRWGISSQEQEIFLEEVWGLLTAPLTLDAMTYSPLTLPAEWIEPEHSFYTAEEKNGSCQLVYGTFDLVIRKGAKVWIVDWKTNEEAMTLSCSNLVEFVDEEGYALQAQVYKQALLSLSKTRYELGGFFFVFSKHRMCPCCQGVVSW